MGSVTIDRILGVYMDSSGGGMDWFVMFISADSRMVAHQHVCPQGLNAAITLIAAFAADYVNSR